NEGGVEPPHDLVSEGVPGVLQVLDLLGFGLGVGIFEGELLENAGGGSDVGRLLLEQIEEFFFPRKQAEHGSILPHRPADVNATAADRRTAGSVDNSTTGGLR